MYLTLGTIKVVVDLCYFLFWFCWWVWQVIFLHPAPLHPHIYSNGHICLGNFVGIVLLAFFFFFFVSIPSLYTFLFYLYHTSSIIVNSPTHPPKKRVITARFSWRFLVCDLQFVIVTSWVRLCLFFCSNYIRSCVDCDGFVPYSCAILITRIRCTF